MMVRAWFMTSALPPARPSSSREFRIGARGLRSYVGQRGQEFILAPVGVLQLLDQAQPFDQVGGMAGV
jgi:hypothetical protein